VRKLQGGTQGAEVDRPGGCETNTRKLPQTRFAYLHLRYNTSSSSIHIQSLSRQPHGLLVTMDPLLHVMLHHQMTLLRIAFQAL
jgi:hypothetical protein